MINNQICNSMKVVGKLVMCGPSVLENHGFLRAQFVCDMINYCRTL